MILMTGGDPIPLDEWREFEIDFIAATHMFGGMDYAEARKKAIEEWQENQREEAFLKSGMWP